MANNELKTAWLKREQDAFEGIDMFVIARLETAILKSIAKTLKDKLADGEKAEVVVPWGTYKANMVKVGETGNINVSYEPAKDFLEVLNADDNSGACNMEASLDDAFRKNFHTYAAYGCFDINDAKNKAIVENINAHGPDLTPDEEEYFLCGYGSAIAQVAKDKQRDNKVYSLQLGESCDENTTGSLDFGKLEFEYNDGNILVKFVASPAFKQELKDDELANAM